MYSRKIYPFLKEHLAKRQITVLTGMRRTGKTTLVKQLLQDIPSDNKLYIDLERIDNRELFSEKNYENIIRALEQRGLQFTQPAYIVLDEIQLVQALPGILKYFYDQYNIKWIVTGSSSFYAKQIFSESLAGRKKLFELYQLDFGEFLTFKQVPWRSLPLFKQQTSAADYERLKSYYEEFIAYGGFPEVVLAATTKDKLDLLSDILSAYIHFDIPAMTHMRRTDALYKIVKLLATRIGTRLEYQKIAQVVGLSRQTTQQYIDFLEQTYVIHRLAVFTHNTDREIVKAQKVYFCDTGLVGILAQVAAGSLFENAIYNQLKHYGQLRYFALKTGKEVDFILNGDKAIEVKESSTTQDLRQLRHLSKYTKIKQCVLVSRTVSTVADTYWGGDIR